MTALLICKFPGDEITLFGNVVLQKSSLQWKALLICADPTGEQSLEDSEDQWRASCFALGIEPIASLRLPLVGNGYYSQASLQSLLNPYLQTFADIYIPDLKEEGSIYWDLIIAIGKIKEHIFIASATGVGTEFCPISKSGMERLIVILNTYYGIRLRSQKIKVSDLHGVRQYRRIKSQLLVQYIEEYVYYNQFYQLNNDNPWDLETSCYEQSRYELEISVLAEISWQSLIEVGACIGSFTSRLSKVFPNRDIIAYEPNPTFFIKLQKRFSKNDRVKVINNDIWKIDQSSDVLFISSVIYYLDYFPLYLLQTPAHYIVFSHIRSFHNQTISPLMYSAGWTCIFKKEILPCIEMFCDIPVQKDGTEIAVWQRHSTK
ncbi:MAG: hypothetical protein F6J89_06445 [Symploca sp. SIO1C4]|uniref:Uncharacterized protein n=1 Tax=Symploca sp. SIO1C4 TaxID=2607765 RepID=A0A6B3N6S1_9CYAN|nr:hypothetical protein [Symploca sp. SIO1C4]